MKRAEPARTCDRCRMSSAGHEWTKHEREGWSVCSRCGMVRNYDREQTTCSGALPKIRQRSEIEDCGQDGVCRLSPGCNRHWEERNRELVRENEVLRSNSDHLSSENASLSRQVESMEMRIKHLLDEMDEWIGRAGEAERLAEERLAHANQLQADIEAEMQGRLALRKRLGAREDETMGAFLERLATMAGVVPVEIHEIGWQWRPTGADTAFAPPFGTIRQCRVCGCLVAGGPTACARCAEAGA